MRPLAPKRVPRLAETVFAVWCEDGPDAPQIRETCLDGHLAYVEARIDRYLIAGPMRRGAEESLSGSLFLILADNEDAARAFMAGDPYVSQGAYARLDYRRLTPAAGRWMGGGVIWESADALRGRANG